MAKIAEDAENVHGGKREAACWRNEERESACFRFKQHVCLQGPTTLQYWPPVPVCPPTPPPPLPPLRLAFAGETPG